MNRWTNVTPPHATAGDFDQRLRAALKAFDAEYRAWRDEAFPGHTIGDPYPAPPRRRRWWRRAT